MNKTDTPRQDCVVRYVPRLFRTPFVNGLKASQYRIDIQGHLWDMREKTFIGKDGGTVTLRVTGTDRKRHHIETGVIRLLCSCWWDADPALIETSQYRAWLLAERAYRDIRDEYERNPSNFTVIPDTDHEGYMLYNRLIDNSLWSEFYRRRILQDIFC